MAISDIPPYVGAQPGDIISSANWDQMQRLSRNSLRQHTHTGVPSSDSSTTDTAAQIATNEIVPGAITGALLANGAVSAANLAAGAVTASAIAAGAVGTAAIASSAVTSNQLSFQRVGTGIGAVTLGPNASQEVLVQSAAPSTKTTIYFPTISITSTTGAGYSDFTANIVYRQAVGATSIDIYIRVSNTGAATGTVIWEVLTFAQ
jgi:hypothetical protein